MYYNSRDPRQFGDIDLKNLPSGTVPTEGRVSWGLAAFSRLGAELAFQLELWSGGRAGRCRTAPPPLPLLGPHVFPFTPSAGTAHHNTLS